MSALLSSHTSFPTLRYLSLWRSLGYLLVAAVVWLSLSPAPPETAAMFGDKLGHLWAYGCLMGWFSQWHSGNQRAKLALGFIAMGLLMEYLQWLGGDRMPEALDMLANTSGVLLAWLLTRTFLGRLLINLESYLARQKYLNLAVCVADKNP